MVADVFNPSTQETGVGRFFCSQVRLPVAGLCYISLVIGQDVLVEIPKPPRLTLGQCLSLKMLLSVGPHCWGQLFECREVKLVLEPSPPLWHRKVLCRLQEEKPRHRLSHKPLHLQPVPPARCAGAMVAQDVGESLPMLGLT